MLAKIGMIISLLSVGTLLGGFGLFSALVLSGDLDYQRAELLLAVLRGEHDELLEPEEEEIVDEGLVEVEPEPTVSTGTAMESMRNRLEERRLLNAEFATEIDAIEARQELLNHALLDLTQRQDALHATRSEFKEDRERARNADSDAGFKRELEYLQSLPAKQAKEHLLFTYERTPTDAVNLLRHIPTNKGKRILEQMKSPEELRVMSELLEQLRIAELEEFEPTGTPAEDPAR